MPRGQKPFFNESQLSDIATQFNGGTSAADIARHFNVGRWVVYRALRVLGLSPDANQRYEGGFNPNINTDLLVSDYQSGMSLEAVSRKNGISYGGLRKRLAKRGVTFRGRYPDIPDFDIQTVVEMYNNGATRNAIAKLFGVSADRIGLRLRAAGVKIRSKGLKGSAHPGWNGGRLHQDGYIRVRIDSSDPLVPMAPSGYAFEHRIVMARKLGRPIESYETVHHINGDRSDNRPENLQLRVGRHGNGKVMCCLDCGSSNIGTLPLP